MNKPKVAQAKYERLRHFWYTKLKDLGFIDIESRVPFDGWTFKKWSGSDAGARHWRDEHVSIDSAAPWDDGNFDTFHNFDTNSLADSPEFEFWSKAEHEANALPEINSFKEFILSVSRSGMVETEAREHGITRDIGKAAWRKFVSERVKG